MNHAVLAPNHWRMVLQRPSWDNPLGSKLPLLRFSRTPKPSHVLLNRLHGRLSGGKKARRTQGLGISHGDSFWVYPKHKG